VFLGGGGSGERSVATPKITQKQNN
jgi:hypothetical protein